MLRNHPTCPTFGQPGWRRRLEDRYGWDKEFVAVGVMLVVFLLSFTFVHADGASESGSLPDPKEMAQPSTPCTTELVFLPLPAWASARMPPLPDQLKPMGRPAVVAKPAPAAMAETKPDQPPMPKKLPQVYPLASSKDPAPAASDTPVLTAVSPFLEWVKDHPQEAAAQARKDAGSYIAPPVVAAPGSAPYWMPPMIDTGGAAPAAQAGDPSSGSAAIYSTPQR